METNDKELPCWLDRPDNWKTEAIIFLNSIQVGESFVLKAPRSIGNMKTLLGTKLFSGTFISRKCDEGTRFMRFKINK
jgi:hypothetical protein